MSILYSPESGFAKEMRKWEAQGTSMGPGERPFVYREYPKMMYRANSPSTIETWEIAADEQAEEALKTRGFAPTPLEALAAHEKQALEFAKLAAEREYDVKYKLSPNAVAEVRAAEAEHSGHMPTMPETPIPRRNR